MLDKAKSEDQIMKKDNSTCKCSADKTELMKAAAA
jgi:hypothetical protein